MYLRGKAREFLQRPRRKYSLYALVHAINCDAYQTKRKWVNEKKNGNAKTKTKWWADNKQQQEIETKIMERDVIGCRSHIAYVKQIICNTQRLKAIRSSSSSSSRNTVITRHISGANGRKKTKKRSTFMRVSSVCYINLAIVLWFYPKIRQCTLIAHIVYKAT